MAMVRVLDWLVGAEGRAAVDWDATYAEELPRVYNFFRYSVGNNALAEDLTSLTFEKAWRSRGRYRDDRAAIGTWLLAIARRVAIDHHRRPRVEVPIGDADPAHHQTPEAQALRTS